MSYREYNSTKGVAYDTHTQTHAHTHTYTHAHTHAHTHTHTHTQVYDEELVLVIKTPARASLSASLLTDLTWATNSQK